MASASPSLDVRLSSFLLSLRASTASPCFMRLLLMRPLVCRRLPERLSDSGLACQDSLQASLSHFPASCIQGFFCLSVDRRTEPNSQKPSATSALESGLRKTQGSSDAPPAAAATAIRRQTSSCVRILESLVSPSLSLSFCISAVVAILSENLLSPNQLLFLMSRTISSA